MHVIVGCAQEDDGLRGYLLLDPRGMPIHVAGQFFDVIRHLLTWNTDEVALVTPDGPKVIRVKPASEGWQKRGEDPYQFFAVVGWDPSDVPNCPQLYAIPLPDLS